MSDILVVQKTNLEMLAKDRQYRLKTIFSDCVGEDNGITRGMLFNLMFGNYKKYNQYQIFWLWQRLKLDLNWLRRTTKFFIVSIPLNGTYKYFVVHNHSEADYYCNIMKNTIKKCKYMENRCRQAVDEKFYLEVMSMRRLDK